MAPNDAGLLKDVKQPMISSSGGLDKDWEALGSQL